MKELWNFGQYTLDVSLATANQSSQSCNAEANTFYIKNISILIIIIIIIKKIKNKIYIYREEESNHVFTPIERGLEVK